MTLGGADVFYRMTPFEVASGWLFGVVPEALPGATRVSALAETSGSSPVQVLESMLAPALARPPCVVAFSGGRDSSALLAVASRLAAREGFEPPVAATLRYPGEHEAHEEQWQELVVRHIGTSNWEKLPAGDSADLLGPVAAGELRRYGLLWPPVHHKDVLLCALAAGGTLVNGEGGDEVLGVHRVTPIARAIAGRLPRNRSEAAETALMLAPRPVRHRVYFARLRAQVAKSWLRPEAQKHFAAAAAADKAAEPLHWGASLRRLPRSRAWNLGFHNQDLRAAADGVTVLRPLQDARFLAALLAERSPLGLRRPRHGHAGAVRLVPAGGVAHKTDQGCVQPGGFRRAQPRLRLALERRRGAQRSRRYRGPAAVLGSPQRARPQLRLVAVGLAGRGERRPPGRADTRPMRRQVASSGQLWLIRWNA